MLEIGPDVVIAEMGGVRAEARGALAGYVREQLADAAIELIRGAVRRGLSGARAGVELAPDQDGMAQQLRAQNRRYMP